MLPVGMVLGFVSYGIGTWGYVLVKGYNITLRQWFSPLNPYQGPLSAAGTVPQGSLFPTGSGGTKAAAGSGAAPGPANTPAERRGQVSSRFS